MCTSCFLYPLAETKSLSSESGTFPWASGTERGSSKAARGGTGGRKQRACGSKNYRPHDLQANSCAPLSLRTAQTAYTANTPGTFIQHCWVLIHKPRHCSNPYESIHQTKDWALRVHLPCTEISPRWFRPSARLGRHGTWKLSNAGGILSQVQDHSITDSGMRSPGCDVGPWTGRNESVAVK